MRIIKNTTKSPVFACFSGEETFKDASLIKGVVKRDIRSSRINAHSLCIALFYNKPGFFFFILLRNFIYMIKYTK